MAASGWRQVRAQAGGTPDLILLRAAFPAADRCELAFDVRTDAEVRVVFGTLRSTTPVSAISLLDPDRRRVWRRAPSELGFVPRSRTPDPERGDAFVLPDARHAARGRWTLLLERGGADMTPGQVLLAWRVLPRFELLLATGSSAVAAGEPVLVIVRASDYGVPVAGLKRVELTVLDSRSRHVGRIPARENALSREGIRLSDEPGSYLGHVTLPGEGAYRLQAEADLGAPGGPTRSAAIDVRAAGQGAN